MKEKEILDKLYDVVVDISERSYSNFITSFKLNKKDYGKCALFEARIYSFFYTDYCVSAKNLSPSIREQLFAYATKKISDEFSKFLQNSDLIELIDYRYNEYANIAMTRGEKWMQSFHTLYEIKLKGTENANSIMKLSPIKFEGAIGSMPGRMQFIRGELENSSRTAKLIDKILNGR